MIIPKHSKKILGGQQQPFPVFHIRAHLHQQAWPGCHADGQLDLQIICRRFPHVDLLRGPHKRGAVDIILLFYYFIIIIRKKEPKHRNGNSNSSERRMMEWWKSIDLDSGFRPRFRLWVDRIIVFSSISPSLGGTLVFPPFLEILFLVGSTSTSRNGRLRWAKVHMDFFQFWTDFGMVLDVIWRCLDGRVTAFIFFVFVALLGCGCMEVFDVDFVSLGCVWCLDSVFPRFVAMNDDAFG